MLNKDFDVLRNWMFGSLSSLLDDITPNPNLNILKMSIGEPQLGPPKFIRDKFDDFFNTILTVLVFLNILRIFFLWFLGLSAYITINIICLV